MKYYNKILHWITTLKEVRDVYEGKTIDNIISQLETIKKEIEKSKQPWYNSYLESP